MWKEAWSAIAGVLALGLCIVLLFALDRGFSNVDSVIFVSLLLFPLIIYLLLSGRLQEFSGPGGWGAKFRDLAGAPVEKGKIVEDTVALQTVRKGGLDNLERLISTLDPKLPNALTLRTGGSRYTPQALTKYLQQLMAVGPSSYVVFVNGQQGKFIGSANASQVISLLQDPDAARAFVSTLRREDHAPRLPFLVTKHLTPDDTNASALRKFLDTNADALVVLSEDETRPIGVVERDRLLTRLMVKLASEGR
jgi:hypothetical protein